MKICLITNNFPPISCGVGDYTSKLAVQLSEFGHEISIICRSSDRIKEYWKYHASLDVYTIGGDWKIKDWKVVLDKIDHLYPDAVLIQYVPSSFDRFSTPWKLIPIYFRLKRRKRSFKLITVFHETYIRLKTYRLKTIYMAISQRAVGLWIAKISTFVITSIDRYEDQLSKWKKRVFKVPIGSNISPFDVSEKDLLKIKERISDNGQLVFSTFGVRDHRLLLEVFERIEAHIKNVTLVIIGRLRGMEINSIPIHLQSKVFVTGFLQEQEVFNYLKASNAFIMLDYVSKDGKGGTSNKSTSLAAAFAAELTVFATKGDMTNQLLLDSDVVIWVPYNNPDNASKIIYENINQFKLKNRSHDFYNKNLSWNKIARSYLKLIESKD